MKVLLIATNIFENIGGGETVYGKIITSNPQIDFYYFSTKKDSLCNSHPVNAHPVRLKPQFAIEVSGKPLFPKHELDALALANQYASSVRGESFDIVDIPDYYSFGAFLRSAFSKHNVTVKKVVLAMHGNLSTSVKLNWDTMGLSVDSMEELERRQFEQVDGIYGISKDYIESWTRKINREVAYIDPRLFVHATYQPQKPENGKLKLCCIGRMERCKGNDIFIDMVKWISPDLYDEAVHIGGDYMMSNGALASYHLSNLARHRDIIVKYEGSYTREQLDELYASRAFIILPTRYDTLNLVVLEALFSGCPVAVSTNAGVCRYLDENYPQIPYIKIDFDNYANSIAEIESALSNYDAYRENLANAVRNTSFPEMKYSMCVMALYEKFLSQPECNYTYIEYIQKTKTIVWKAKEIGRNLGLAKFRKTVKNLPATLRNKLLSLYKKMSHMNPELFGNAHDSRRFRNRAKAIGCMEENSIIAKRQKLENTYNLCNNRIFRCNAYDEIARQQRRLGYALYGVAYELRLLRLAHRNDQEILSSAVSTLKENGHEEEANVASLLYRGIFKNGAYEYLAGNYKKWLTNPAKDVCEIYEDHRKWQSKVTVIVSLYNAADKLDFFISMLMRQTLFNKKKMEIIFVDSCSPMDEYSIIKKYEKKLSFIYLRSSSRETIQKAWNRALNYTTSEYITFLGVDEMIYPVALEHLMDALDGNRTVDWVVGNSLVTNVEMNGILKNDAMIYNRDGGMHRSANFETCYLTYVGGLYRRDVHDRFGYYDESFRGAGDTEFKNRILPFIKVDYLDETLGIFLDYPQERVTASPMAEIEDLRAWYIFRTPAGIRYEYEKSSIREMEEALCMSLQYRKSYYTEDSTDFEYAACLVEYLLERDPENKLAKGLEEGIKVLLSDAIALEYVNHLPKKNEGYKLAINAWRHAKKYQKIHSQILGIPSLRYDIVNDNRYQQHGWLWKPDLSKSKG